MKTDPAEIANKIIDTQHRDYMECQALLNDAMKILLVHDIRDFEFATKVESHIENSRVRLTELKKLFKENSNGKTTKS